MSSIFEKIQSDSALWRNLARRGASRGPRWVQRWTPTPIGLAFCLWPSSRRATLLQRLRDVLGPRGALQEARDIAATYACFAHSLADSLAVAEGAGAASITTSGVPSLTQALSQQHGVILGTAHTAGWEVALAELRRHCDAPIAVLMRKERDQVARQAHATLSASRALSVVEVGDDPFAALPLVAHLRRGGIVAVQMDRCPPGMRALDAVSHGVSFRLPAGPFLLAAATGAPIIMTLSSRVAFRSYHAALSAPVSLPRRASAKQSSEAANQIAGELVHFVREHPSQWFAFEA